MYPMNALVSDQISRLRRLMGDEQRKFVNIFRETAGGNARRPQFGMYTGRTPYPGSAPDKHQDRALADTLATKIKIIMPRWSRKERFPPKVTWLTLSRNYAKAIIYRIAKMLNLSLALKCRTAARTF